MIAARKSPIFAAWFARDAEKRIFRAFGEVRVRGLQELRAITASAPVLVVSNHTSWWDPLVVLMLCTRILRVDAYAMMDAKNLRRLPFFGKVGAFGVDLDDAVDGARAIRYAAKLLQKAGRVVWIFAQGKEVPITARPLVFRGGTGEIARVAKRALLVPVAIRYEHGSRAEPTLYISVGAGLDAELDVTRGRAAQEEAVTAELDRIDRSLIEGDFQGFEVLHRREPSWLMTIAERMLAWLTRPRLGA